MRTTICVKAQLDPSKDLVLDASWTPLDSIQGVLTQNVDPYARLRPMDCSLFHVLRQRKVHLEGTFSMLVVRLMVK